MANIKKNTSIVAVENKAKEAAKAIKKTGLGKKIAIGGTIAAGVAGLGYGGYKLMRNNNNAQ